MVTLQRRAEVTGMALSEIDREKRLWLLPPERTKNRRAHVVPLSPLALELIDLALSVRNAESDYVFPSPSKFRSADQTSGTDTSVHSYEKGL